MAQSLFTWVHLSDIHIGHGGSKHKWDQELVLNCLKDDIAAAPNRNIPTINAFFVTGDLAFSGGCKDADEYKKASHFLLQTAETVSLDEKNIYVIPGNHDIQRSVENKNSEIMDLLIKLRSGQKDIDAALDIKKEKSFLTRRISNYLNFSKQFAPFILFDDKKNIEPFWNNEILLEHDFKIHLVGLNTTLLAAKEEDEYGDFKRLQLGKRQIAQSFLNRSSTDKEIVIVLSHHPFDWLRDGNEVTAPLYKYAHIHLCGHIHDARTEEKRSGAGTELISIVSGAAHDEPYPNHIPARHGYNIASLILENEQVVLRIWPRIWSKHFEFRVDKDSIPSLDENKKPYNKDFVDHKLNLRKQIPTSSSGIEIKHVNPFQLAGGLPETAKSYVLRECDDEIQKALSSFSLIAIHGEYQIGKTSLLNQINKLLLANWRICKCNLEGMRTDKLPLFLDEFFEAISKETNSVNSWQNVADSAKEMPLAILLDEFGCLEHLSSQAGVFIQKLVWLATELPERVRIIVCLRNEIKSFIPKFEANPKYASAWKNVHVKPFENDKEYIHLIDMLPSNISLILKNHFSTIKYKTQGKPQKIQILCEKLFKLNQEKINNEQIIQIINDDQNYIL